MLHALTYSIITHIKTHMSDVTNVIWMYDGVSLTNVSKPFSTVEQMPTNVESLSAGHEDFEEIYRFQIGLHTRSVSERSKLTEKLTTVLRQKNISFFDTSGSAPVSAGFFVCDVTGVTPIPVDDVADTTNQHRVYFDVEVTVYRQNGDSINFTQ